MRADDGRLATALRRHGLRPGRGRWLGAGLRVHPDGRWLIVIATRRAATPPALDMPGPWKCRNGRLTLDLPVAALDGDTGGDTGDDDLDRCLIDLIDWAAMTRRGEIPPGWTPPDGDDLARAVPATELSLSAGPFLAAARWVVEPRRLALQTQLAPIDAGLPEARHRWIDRLCSDAQRLRLVRVARSPGGASLAATVDLTGCPRPLVLAPFAAAALRVAWEQLVATATCLGDAGCGATTLDMEPA